MYRVSFALIITSTILAFCANSKTKKTLKAISVYSYFPVFDKERDTVFMFKTNDSVYFYKDMILYDKESSYIDANGNETDYTTKYIFRIQEKIGIRYDPVAPNVGMITFYADSFMRKHSFDAMPFEKAIAESDSLFSTASQGGRKFKEEYFHSELPDETYNNIDVFFYDRKFPLIPFSISNRLDSIKKAKLVRYQAIYHAIPNSPYKALRKERVIDIGIKEIPVKNIAEIMGYFVRYEKDSKGKLPEPPKSHRIP